MKVEAKIDILATEKTYLVNNNKELSATFPGKYLLIKGEEVHGAFETFEQGVIAGVQIFGSGPFLVRLVSQLEDAEPPNIPALSVGVSLIANS